MITTGLIGYPTEHSISPMLFNYFAKINKIEYSHVKLTVLPKRGNLKRAIEGLRALNIKGVNITLPYKMKVVEYVDSIDSEAKKIGAINTIVNNNGKLRGYNTDSYGAIKAMEISLGRNLNKKDNILIIGSGGASRALIYGFMQKGCGIKVAYRLPKSIRTKDISIKYKNQLSIFPINAFLYKKIADASIICNATNLGMWPKINDLPINEKQLLKAKKMSSFSNKLFFDVIFNPYETKFLKIAKKMGAKVQGGLDMMIYQGVLAFKLWTGYDIDNKKLSNVRNLLINAYEK